MKNVILLLLTLLLISASGCTQNESIEPDYFLKYGISFGECLGDCYQELTISKYKVVLRVKEYRRAKQSELEIRAEKPLCISEYEQINLLVDEESILTLPEVIGCPDCVDGGAEWIELRSSEIRKKITFEYQNAPPSLQNLVRQLRTLHKELYEPKPAI